jgi:hypothetical protein
MQDRYANYFINKTTKCAQVYNYIMSERKKVLMKDGSIYTDSDFELVRKDNFNLPGHRSKRLRKLVRSGSLKPGKLPK